MSVCLLPIEQLSVHHRSRFPNISMSFNLNLALVFYVIQFESGPCILISSLQPRWGCPIQFICKFREYFFAVWMPMNRVFLVSLVSSELANIHSKLMIPFPKERWNNEGHNFNHLGKNEGIKCSLIDLSRISLKGCFLQSPYTRTRTPAHFLLNLVSICLAKLLST